MRRIERHRAGGVGQLAGAAPELEAEIVDRVMPIRVGGEHRAIEILLRPGEEARDVLELRPAARRGQRVAIARGEGHPLGGRLEQIAAVDKALRPVVVGHAIDRIAELLETSQRRRPAMRVVGDRRGAHQRGEIQQRTALDRFGQPVRIDKGDVPGAVLQPRARKQRLVERVQVERLELQPQRAAGGRLKVGVLLLDRALERAKLADGDTKDISRVHRSNSCWILSLCSPIFGAPVGDVRIAPSIRIGQRVVNSDAPLERLTRWTIRKTSKASCCNRRGQVKTSAHQTPAGSRMLSQCAVLWPLRCSARSALI